MTFKIKITELKDKIDSNKLPTYESSLLNIANRYSKGTSDKVVGQMTELVRDWRKSTTDHSFENWKEWYLSRHPNSIRNATEKNKEKLEEFRKIIENTDEEIITKWVE